MFSGQFKIAILKEVFKDGYGEMHDVLFEATGLSCDEAECHLAFWELPELMQCEALKWGLGDTEFRDEAYTYFKKKVKDNE